MPAVPLLRPAAALAPGLALAACGAGLAFALHALVPAVPALTAAVVLGLAAANLPGRLRSRRAVLSPGTGFAARTLLRAGIVLLGLKVVLGDLAALGVSGLAVVVALVGCAFAGTWWICRALKLPGDQPVLVAAGFSICGVSAIGAVAAARGSAERDTAVPAALVTLCGTLAIALMPVLGLLLDLPEEAVGYWTGASVHDVGQVVAAAQSAGGVALAAAVTVKLGRVILLAPVAALAGLAARRSGPAGASAGRRRSAPVPLFVLGFLAAIGLRALGLLPDPVLAGAAAVQEVLFAVALFGLGYAVRAAVFAGAGARSLAAAGAAWVLVLALGLGAAMLLIR